MSSTQPRTQRKRAANAPLHTKRIMASSHLAPEIHDKSKAHLPRALPVRKGDTVRIMRGGFRGKEGKVVSVDRVHGTVVIEGITIEKVDEKKVARPLHASNLLIVRMDDTDPSRRRRPITECSSTHAAGWPSSRLTKETRSGSCAASRTRPRFGGARRR